MPAFESPTIVTVDDTGQELLADMNEPTGFSNRTDSAFTFTNSTRTLSIAPVSGSFDYFVLGTKYTKTSAEALIITDVEGIHVVYFEGSGLRDAVNPTTSEVEDLITEKALVSIIYWDASNKEAIYVGEERHGITMDGETHKYIHFHNGLTINSGLAPVNVVADGSTSSNASAQFGVDSGTIADEDIKISTSAVASTVGFPIFYMSGSSAAWRRTDRTGYSVLNAGTSTDRLVHNEYTGGAWQLTEITEHDFVLCHLFATTEKDTPIVAILGQDDYTTKRKARSGAKTEIHSLVLDDLLFPEIRPIATFIFQTDKDWTNAIHAKIVTDDDGNDYVDWRSQTISRVSLTSDDHNSLSNLQGGDSSLGEYIHLTQAEYDALMALLP